VIIFRLCRSCIPDMPTTPSITCSLICILATAGAVPIEISVSPVSVSSAGWVLTWEDDFDGSVLNASNWNVASNRSHCEPCEAELYVPWRVNVSNSNLVITTSREQVFGPNGQLYNWTSGWIDTKGKFAQLYGLFEARVKLPSQNATGSWPAFWTLPDSDDCWPTQGVSCV
jgi:beta-glucanase (GH16 family)